MSYFIERINMRVYSLLFLLVAISMNAQTGKNALFVQYVEQYKECAIEQMRKYKIPASITLAQGLLESGAGRSELAQRSNNHFGIKCGSTWKGKTTRHTDDKRNECFRVYDSVKDSYRDHSEFLLKPRYKSLFDLDPLDYKAWARGLKVCGYATSPVYANKLIEIIEKYELYMYDEDRFGMKRHVEKYDEINIRIHKIEMNNDVMCVRVRQGDTWESLSKELALSLKKLYKYNDAEERTPLVVGGYVYMEKKQKKASSEFKRHPWHKVVQGESMYSISQFYGIRLKNLYKMNFKTADYVPVEGDLLKIR